MVKSQRNIIDWKVIVIDLEIWNVMAVATDLKVIDISNRKHVIDLIPDACTRLVYSGFGLSRTLKKRQNMFEVWQFRLFFLP